MQIYHDAGQQNLKKLLIAIK